MTTTDTYRKLISAGAPALPPNHFYRVERSAADTNQVKVSLCRYTTLWETLKGDWSSRTGCVLVSTRVTLDDPTNPLPSVVDACRELAKAADRSAFSEWVFGDHFAPTA